jgi:ribose 5-phosphate isomerase B
MHIYLGTDHVGFKLKEAIKPFLEGMGFEVEDKGALMLDSEDDYPDFVTLVAKAVGEEPVKRKGVVFGYSGQAEAIVCNRIEGVRAAVYYGEAKPLEENAKKGKPVDIITATREDNDSNILSIGAGFVSEDDAKNVIKKWLETPFTGEDRHIRRIAKIDHADNIV